MISQCHTVKAVISKTLNAVDKCVLGSWTKKWSCGIDFLVYRAACAECSCQSCVMKMKMRRANTSTRISAIGSAYEDRNHHWKKDLIDKLWIVMFSQSVWNNRWRQRLCCHCRSHPASRIHWPLRLLTRCCWTEKFQSSPGRLVSHYYWTQQIM